MRYAARLNSFATRPELFRPDSRKFTIEDVVRQAASVSGLLVVNAIEAEALSGLAATTLQDASQAARHRLGVADCAIVTAGAEGATPGQRSEIPAHKVEVDSTHGAGDCFVGSLAAFLAGGDDIEAAAQRANDAAARRVASAADTADILSMPD